MIRNGWRLSGQACGQTMLTVKSEGDIDAVEGGDCRGAAEVGTFELLSEIRPSRDCRPLRNPSGRERCRPVLPRSPWHAQQQMVAWRPSTCRCQAHGAC